MSIEQPAYYNKIGAGKNVVLVHGWGVDSAIWHDLVEKLSMNYCVYLVDLPGFGEQAEIADYSLSSIAETILAKLPNNAVWCGWSLGGLIATYVAQQFPERVDKLVQVCASMRFVEQAPWLGVKEDVFEAFKLGVNKQPKKTLNRFLSLQAMGSETIKSDIVTIKKLLVNQPTPKPSALIAGLDLLNETDLRDAFSQLSMPCLSVFGEHDTLIPIANIEAVKKLQPLQQQAIFKHSSHAPFISEKDHFIDVLKYFMGD